MSYSGVERRRCRSQESNSREKEQEISEKERQGSSSQNIEEERTLGARGDGESENSDFLFC